jgi:hypothetical protein
MLSCFGYSGVVSFTDIEIVPGTGLLLPAGKRMREVFQRLCFPFLPENNNWMSADAIVAPCASQAVTQERDGNQFRQYLSINWGMDGFAECPSSELANKLTLALHTSLDRISVLEKSLQDWNGIVSLSVFVPIANMTEGLSEWQRSVIAGGMYDINSHFPVRLYLEKKIRSLSMSKCSRVTLLLAQSLGDEVTDYPINHLYNAAIRGVSSQFVLLVDGDFQVSPGLEIKFRESVDMSNVSGKAFVVPAFEWMEPVHVSCPVSSVTMSQNVISVTRQEETVNSKAELIQLIFRDDPLVQPFQSYDAPESQKLTNYFKWYQSSSAYQLHGFADKYQPYFIME